METIVRENKPVSLEGVVKSRVDDSKWEGLDKLDVGSKFLMFEKGMSEEREHKVASDRLVFPPGSDILDLCSGFRYIRCPGFRYIRVMLRVQIY